MENTAMNASKPSAVLQSISPDRAELWALIFEAWISGGLPCEIWLALLRNIMIDVFHTEPGAASPRAVPQTPPYGVQGGEATAAETVEHFRIGAEVTFGPHTGTVLCVRIEPGPSDWTEIWMNDFLVKPASAGARVPSDTTHRAASNSKQNEAGKPTWDGGILSFRDVIVKKFGRHPASNQRALLNAFQAAGWPRVVTNPFRGTCNTTLSRTLNETLRDLNRSIAGGPLRFEADGKGGCRWLASSP